MKVLVQEWDNVAGGQATSISKDREQLDETIKRVAPQKNPHDEGDILNYKEATVPDGDATEVEIPDDSVFAEMVGSRTVFLHSDEMDVLWASSSSQD